MIFCRYATFFNKVTRVSYFKVFNCNKPHIEYIVGAIAALTHLNNVIGRLFTHLQVKL